MNEFQGIAFSMVKLAVDASFFRLVLVQCQYRLRTPLASKVSFAVAKTTTTIAKTKGHTMYA